MLSSLASARRDPLRRLVVLIALLNGADVLTTVLALRLGGVEGSPLYALLFGHLSVAAGVGVKLLASALLVAYIVLITRRFAPRRYVIWELRVVALLWLLVVANNLWTLHLLSPISLAL